MNKKLSRLLEPNLKLYFFFLAVFSLAAIPFQPLLALGEGCVTAVLYLYFNHSNQLRRQRIIQYIDNLTGSVDTASKSTLINSPLPIMALNVALNVAKASQKTVAVFSLEMSKEQLVTRLLSAEALVENNRLKTGDLRETDWVKIADASTVLTRLDIRIDDNPLLSVADMNAKCRRLENLGLVVIDYLQLMTSAGGKGYSGENRQQVVSDISRMMKIMAKELDVPVICLSQLSRANEKRDDKRPMLSDLRESGAIEQDADIVLFLYRDDYYNEDTEKHNIAECIVAKNRHEPPGGGKRQQDRHL
jgi:Replicative DNA helicase